MQRVLDVAVLRWDNEEVRGVSVRGVKVFHSVWVGACEIRAGEVRGEEFAELELLDVEG